MDALQPPAAREEPRSRTRQQTVETGAGELSVCVSGKAVESSEARKSKLRNR